MVPPTSDAIPVQYFDRVTLYNADCLTVLRKGASASVDSVVTDPPYGLEFMGREWDGADGFRRSLNPADVGRDNPFGRTSRTSPEYRAGHLFQEWCEAWAAECLRVLKPGGHLLAFGGTRTWHRLACAVEDAGFEIRDSIAWLYGSGFPKSLDVSKAIDRTTGVERQIIGQRATAKGDGGTGNDFLTPGSRASVVDVTIPATADGLRWQGWGTALKPGFEPVVVARKPLVGTVAANVVAHGTGALNIDGCRIGDGTDSQGERPTHEASSTARYDDRGAVNLAATPGPRGGSPAGRWPANVALDESQAKVLDQQSGILTSGKMAAGTRPKGERETYGQDAANGYETQRDTPGDSGGASRFFYVAKADATERPRVNGTAHPTVKPLDYMRWLVRLVTPPGGTVLEPFAGSGTTVEACILEGFKCIAIERETEYLPLIEARIARRLDPVRAVELTRTAEDEPDLFGGVA